MFQACAGCRVRMTTRDQTLCHPCTAELEDGFAQLLTQAATPASGMDAPDDEAA